jgi:hypothetical protein
MSELPLPKRILLVIALALAGLALVETSARLLVSEDARPVSWALTSVLGFFRSPQPTISAERPWVRPHPDLGYSLVPGTHRITHRQGDLEEVFTVTIDETGHRVTSSFAGTRLHLPEVWICGGANTWGYLVSDPDTFPWLIQDQFPGYWVRNMGAPGYSTVHAYLELKKALESGAPVPKLLVVVYNPADLRSNVARDAMLGLLLPNATSAAEVRFPSVSVSPDGFPVIGWRPASGAAGEATRLQQIEAGQALFGHLKLLADKASIRMAVAVQSGDLLDPVIQFGRTRGITYSPMMMNGREAHANSKAHKYFAGKLAPALRAWLPPSGPAMDAGGAVFVLEPGGAVQQRMMRLTNPSNSPLTLRCVSSRRSGETWLSVLPEKLTLRPGESSEVAIIADPGKLRAGEFHSFFEILGRPAQKMRVDVTAKVLNRRY